MKDYNENEPRHLGKRKKLRFKEVAGPPKISAEDKFSYKKSKEIMTTWPLAYDKTGFAAGLPR